MKSPRIQSWRPSLKTEMSRCKWGGKLLSEIIIFKNKCFSLRCVSTRRAAGQGGSPRNRLVSLQPPPSSEDREKGETGCLKQNLAKSINYNLLWFRIFLNTTQSQLNTLKSELNYLLLNWRNIPFPNRTWEISQKTIINRPIQTEKQHNYAPR